MIMDALEVKKILHSECSHTNALDEPMLSNGSLCHKQTI